MSIAHKNPSEETRKKISEAGKGRIVSLETRQKSSESHKGQVAWNKGKKTGIVPWNKGKQNVYSEETRKKMGYWKGKKHSEETRKKISKSSKGMKFSEEHRKKLSKSATGRIMSEESIKKTSAANTGRKDSEETIKRKKRAQSTPEVIQMKRERMLGKKHSEETIKKLIRIQNTPERIQRQREIRSKIKIPSKDSKIELQTQKILIDAGIKFEKHIHVPIAKYKEHELPPTKEVDILIKPNKIIEVNGHYHFDPRIYHINQEVRRRDKTITPKEVWDEEKLMLKQLRKSGHEILVIWDLDLKKDLDKTTKKILKFAKS